jgi:hypothetical protein
VKTDIRRHILTLSLGAAMAVLSGPALHAQSTTPAPSTTTSPAPDNGQDMRVATNRAAQVTARNKQDSQKLQQQVRSNKAQLKSDMKTYGKNSSQVAADKAQLRRDAQLKHGLNRHVRADRGHVARLNHVARTHGHR